MAKVLDSDLIERAFREAERALAVGDPDTLAGRFSLTPMSAEAIDAQEGARRDEVTSR